MNRAGLTLIELVVALTISSLAMAAGYGALGAIVDHRRRVEEASAAVARAAAERGLVESWLAGAHLTVEEGGPAFRGLDGVSGDSADDELTVLTTTPTPLGTGETIVRLYVDRDERTPERGLTAAFAEWRGTAVGRLEIDDTLPALLRLPIVVPLAGGR